MICHYKKLYLYHKIRIAPITKPSIHERFDQLAIAKRSLNTNYLWIYIFI